VILIDQRKLRFLKAGRVLSVEVRRPYRLGHDYSAGHRHGHTVCRVRVLACTPIENGFTLEVCQHTQAPALYLARNPGAQRADYVPRPEQAAKDAAGPLEAPDPAWLRREALSAFRRDDERRRERAAEAYKARTKRYAVPELSCGTPRARAEGAPRS
jgi:hypothetical protein